MTGIPSFVADRAVFVSALEKIERAIERRNTIPILANVLIRSEADKVVVISTDLDLQITASFPATVDAAGATTLPGELLSSLVRKMPDGAAIKLAPTKGLEGQSMTMTSGRSKAVINSLPASDYPNFMTKEYQNEFTIKSSVIREMLAATAFAISSEETRYYLNGIYWHVDKSNGAKIKLAAVSTDGHRLSRYTIPLPDGAENMPGIIIPRKTIAIIQALVKTGDIDLTFRVSDTKVEVEAPNFLLHSKLIDGTFPDYTRVIPNGNNRVGEFDRKPLTDAVDRVTTISGDRGRAVKFSFTNGRVDLTVVNADRGSAEEDVGISYDSDDLDIGFNAQYVKEVFMALAADRIRVALADAGSPAIFTDVTDSEAQHLVVLMPMRV